MKRAWFVVATLAAALFDASGAWGHDPAPSPEIDWVDPTTLQVIKRIVTGATDRGVPYTNEGMTVRGGELYLLPEDDHSRLFRYRLP